MPWQRRVVDVALEIREDGLPAYRRVVLTVPRQSGKTTLLLALFVHRAIGWPKSPQNMTYAAQNGVDARKKFVDDQMPILKFSPFKGLYKPRLTSGHEAILWSNGSRHTISAATEKTGHGQILDLAVIDEAFAQPDARLEQAFSPAMVTRRDAQFWVVSTAGTADSLYLFEKVEAGRAHVDDTDSGVAYFEWAADESEDPDDPATWWGCMPALGYTVTEDIIRSEHAGMTAPDFARAYLNQWTVTAEGAVIPDEMWAAHAEPDAPMVPSAFAVDVSPLRDRATIVACGVTTGGRPLVEITAEDVDGEAVLDYRPGTDWVVPRLLRLCDRWEIRSVWMHGIAADALRADIEKAGITVNALTSTQMSTACGVFYDSAVLPQGRGLAHTDQRDLTRALKVARRAETDTGWQWGRRKSAGDISPLVAATVALHGYLNAPPTGFFMTRR